MSCCSNTLVPARCTDITAEQKILSDQNGNALVDDNGQDFTLGLNREGTNFEFEFNRQESIVTP